MEIIVSEHAATEIRRRAIQLGDVEQVFQNPQQILIARTGRRIYRSIIEMNSKPYLLRLIVDEETPPVLVTVYRTSKIKKYWRQT